MSEERCIVELGAHARKGYILYVKGDCAKVLEDIKKHSGDYGHRLFESKLVFENNTELSSPSVSTTEQKTEPVSGEKQT